jgi:uncharacterized protein YegP (UPF0339 family)
MNALRTAFFAAVIVTLSACGGQEATVGQSDEASDSDASALTSAKFETFEGKDGRYYFHLLAGNGQKVLASQGYASRSSANDGIASVRANSADTSRYFLREASDGSWYFVVIATNGKIIGISEMYVSQANATKGMTTVQSLVQIAAAPASAPTGAPIFETFKGVDSKYYFHLKAANGQVIAHGETYASQSAAQDAVTNVVAMLRQ